MGPSSSRSTLCSSWKSSSGGGGAAAADAADGAVLRLPPHRRSRSRQHTARCSRGRSQSLVVSGESGAGKTELTRSACAPVGRAHMGDAGGGGAAGVGGATGSAAGASGGAARREGVADRRVTCSWGTALSITPCRLPVQAGRLQPATRGLRQRGHLRNRNSSRFGKLGFGLGSGLGLGLQPQPNPRPNRASGCVMLRPSGVVHSAELSTFLLEKARVTSQLPGERNYICTSSRQRRRRRLPRWLRWPPPTWPCRRWAASRYRLRRPCSSAATIRRGRRRTARDGRRRCAWPWPGLA